MEIPGDARQLLTPYFGEKVWEVADLHVGAFPEVSTLVPRSLVKLAITYVTVPASRGLRTVGMTVGTSIYLHPEYADLSTAAGLALLAHEMEHVRQAIEVADFDRVYENAARVTPHDRPWENPYEYVAYRKEQKVYCDKVAEGMPKGRWIPLGVQLWGC